MNAARRCLTILAVSVLGGLVLYDWTKARPVGVGPAGPPLAAGAFHKVWRQQPVLLLALGDSVTAGFGARPGFSYFDRLLTNGPADPPEMQGLHLRAVFPHFRHRNLAVSGSTSLDHEMRQVSKLSPSPTNVFGIVVITTGGNDLIHHYGRLPPREGAAYGATAAQASPWVARFQERLQRMFQAIELAFPGGCHIFIATIYDPTDGSGDLEHAGLGLPPWPEAAGVHRQYNDAIRRAARTKSNVTVVDVHEAFLGHGLHCRQPWHPHYQKSDPHYWFYDNLEDPNERGYDAIRRLFLKAMAEKLGG